MQWPTEPRRAQQQAVLGEQEDNTWGAWLLMDACRDLRPSLSSSPGSGPSLSQQYRHVQGNSGLQADSQAGDVTEACQAQRRLCWVRGQAPGQQGSEAGECHGASSELVGRGAGGILRAELQLRGPRLCLKPVLALGLSLP